MKTFAKIFVIEAGLILVIGLLMLLAGCCPKVVQMGADRIDSVRVVERERIDTVFFPGEMLTIDMEIECDSVTNKPKPATFSKQQGGARTTITVDDQGRLQGRAGCDSLAAVVKLKDIEIFRLQKEKTASVVEVAKPTPWYDMMCRWIAGIVVLLTAAKFYFRF